jgi:hypothetical protein
MMNLIQMNYVGSALEGHLSGEYWSTTHSIVRSFAHFACLLDSYGSLMSWSSSNDSKLTTLAVSARNFGSAVDSHM